MSPRTSGAKRKSYKEQSQSDIDESSDASLNLSESSDGGSPDNDSDSQPAKKRKTPVKEKKNDKKKVIEKPEKKVKALSSESNQYTKTVSEKANTASTSMIENHVSIGISASSSIDITQGPPIATDTAAKKLILQYMKQQNRPYSMIQIHDNLHKRIPKATLDRVLNTMSGAGGELVCKEYGKSKIYYVDQSTFAGSVKEDQLEDLQIENEELKKEVQDIAQEEKRLQTELIALQKEPADEDLER
jgi:26S proteasome regulatory subunit (ATPase 3-interacting protein)